jgi:hypothetical protein
VVLEAKAALVVAGVAMNVAVDYPPTALVNQVVRLVRLPEAAHARLA